MSGVRGKFFVAETTRSAHGANKVKLSAVSRGAHNAAWSKASPSGTIELTIDNEPAFLVFEDLVKTTHREVYVDFTPVPAETYNPQLHEFEQFRQDGHYVDGKCLECGEAEAAHTGTS